MSYLARPTPADADIGGKARALARLAAAGMPVPPAVVITGRLFAELRAGGPALPPDLSSPAALGQLDHVVARLRQSDLPLELSTELGEALCAMGNQRFSVRSSFAAEDCPEALGSGVYRSCTNVAAADVPRAIRDVLASALSPGAVTYARRHGTDPEAGPFAVLVHPFVPGLGGAAAWDPRHMAEPLIEPRAGLTEAATELIASACRTLASQMGAVEVEWATEAGRVTFLQVRPYVAPSLPQRWSQRRAELEPGGWTWDAAHNPLPLSPAQAGLVEIADQRCTVGFRQRVEGGYLFFSPVDAASRPTPLPADRLQAELQAMSAGLDAELGALGDEPELPAALQLFLRGYQQIFGTIQPTATRARRELARFLETNLPARQAPMRELVAGVPSRATERLQLADAIATAAPEDRPAAIAAYLARFGDEAPVWDVAVPTFREAPARVAQLAARGLPRSPAPDADRAARLVAAALPPAVHSEWKRLLSSLREAVAAGEEDDWLYARLQASVRRALLMLGRKLATNGQIVAGDDVFWLPLEWSMMAALGRALPGDAMQAVRQARQRHLEELADPPPASWARGAGAHMHERGVADDSVLRGETASAGRAVARVVLHGSGMVESEASKTVLVAPTLLPSELPLVNAAALVTEAGHPLDHVSAQARERGIPAVVGVTGACRVLRDGELVLVDADAGLIVRL